MLSEKKFNDTLLTLHEVQEIFRCGKRQAYELVRVHGFPAIKIGGKYLISAKALKRWLQSNAGKGIIK